MLSEVHFALRDWVRQLALCRRRLDNGDLDEMDAMIPKLRSGLNVLQQKVTSGFAVNWYLENTINNENRHSNPSPFLSRTVQSGWKLCGSHAWLDQQLARLERDYQVVSGIRMIEEEEIDACLEMWEAVLRSEPDHALIRQHLASLSDPDRLASNHNEPHHQHLERIERKYNIKPFDSVTLTGLKEISIAWTDEILTVYDRIQHKFYTADIESPGKRPVVHGLELVPEEMLRQYRIHFAALLNDHELLLYSYQNRSLYLWRSKFDDWKVLHKRLSFIRHRVDGRYLYFNDFDSGMIWRMEREQGEDKTCIYRSKHKLMDFDFDTKGRLHVIEGDVKNDEWSGSLVRCTPKRTVLLENEKRLVSMLCFGHAIWGLSRQPVILHKIDPESCEQIIRWPLPLLPDANQMSVGGNILYVHFNGGNYVHRFMIG